MTAHPGAPEPARGEGPPSAPARPAARASVVAGRVTADGADQGIAGLVVELHHLDGRSGSRRLGSTSTAADGSFRVVVAPEADGAADHRLGWNLQLQILSPERGGLSRTKRLLFTSEVRRRAGLREEFRVGLSARRLKAAGVGGGSFLSSPGQALAESVRVGALRADEMQLATDRLVEERLKGVVARRTVLRDDIRTRLVQELSTVSDRERASGRFVGSLGDIGPVYQRAIITDVGALTGTIAGVAAGTRVPRFQRPSRLVLNDQQRAALLGNRAGPTRVSEADLERVLGRTLDKPAAIYRRALPFDPCRPETDAERCLAQDGSGSAAGVAAGGAGGAAPITAPTNGNVPGTNVTFSKRAVIASLMSRQTKPEDPVEFGARGGELEPALTAGGVDDVIRGIVFAPGPADVPAFHDFHDIQIAFEPVWQEALDDRYLDDVEEAYDRIVENGGAPAATTVTGILTAPGPAAAAPVGQGGFFAHLLDALSDLVAALDSEVPASVAAAVLISLEEWRALPGQSRRELSILAGRMRELREKIILALDPDNLPDIDFLNIVELIRAAQTKQSIAYRSQI